MMQSVIWTLLISSIGHCYFMMQSVIWTLLLSSIGHCYVMMQCHMNIVTQFYRTLLCYDAKCHMNIVNQFYRTLLCYDAKCHMNIVTQFYGTLLCYDAKCHMNIVTQFYRTLLCYDAECITLKHRPCGLMDKASVSGAEDCGFESHQGRTFLFCPPTASLGFRTWCMDLEVILGFAWFRHEKWFGLVYLWGLTPQQHHHGQAGRPLQYRMTNLVWPEQKMASFHIFVFVAFSASLAATEEYQKGLLPDSPVSTLSKCMGPEYFWTQWVNEWVNEWVHEWVSEWVSEWWFNAVSATEAIFTGPSLPPIHVNLYGMSVSFTDFHPFKLLPGVHLKSYGL